MCHQIEKCCEAAYFTVEAALILPMTMLFTVMMIFLAIYSYDRCVMEHSAYEAALRGTASHFGTAEEAESAARAAAGELVKEKLFAIQDFSYDVLVDAKSVTVTYHCVVNMPFITWLGEYVSRIDTTLDISRSAGRLRPTRTIRDCRILNGLIAE
ncbi:MAG: pilus assembly protein [Lachnospiraceae bacterium]|nr:pilus assembly protein [Lachnospiraceae bacterium]